ncbi:MAG: nucleotide pyrophosphatase/phosphodiesterase family protein [Verrucomicrobiota bacterium]
MNRTVVINVVGLTESLIGGHTPKIREFMQRGAKANISPAFPAVTCTAQSNYLTGTAPTHHGIVANGWYNRDLAEVQFWKQSNHLVQGQKIWDELRALDPKFTCAKLFWWYNMYSSADYSITPRPMYPADGRKVFDIYTQPGDLRFSIKADLGEFPFPTFWGPGAGIKTPQGEPDACSHWIAESAKWIENKYSPTLNLVYLPHLDYNLQRHGPFGVPPSVGASDQSNRVISRSTDRLKSELQALNPAIIPDLEAIDAIVGDLISFFESRGVQVILISEYGITNVDTPIHLNRLFRTLGGPWLAVREELGLEILNAGASDVFTIPDHQIAHIYLNNPSIEGAVRNLVEVQTGSVVLGKKEKRDLGIDHPRSGDLIAIAPENAWFTYYYWLDDTLAPDFARCVDIHRKPGYDPVELFLDPKIPLVKLKILRRLLQKKLGFRMLMDVIPLDATLVKGSHGRTPANVADYPLFISSRADLVPNGNVESTDIYHLIKRHVMH